MSGSRDALTGLLDRGAFDGYLSAAIADASHCNEPLAVVMADVDHFKRVNDTHGHQAGDGVLKRVAECFATVTRSKGECFRYGGEEFVMVLPNHSVDEAIAASERARLEVESRTANGIAVTASFGIACMPQHGDHPETVVGAADKALYDAKRLGRNLVRVYGEPNPERAAAQPSRKVAMADGGFTQDERWAIRQHLLKHGVATCPRDGAVLESEPFTPLGTAIRQFFVMCPGCGLNAHLTGDDV